MFYENDPYLQPFENDFKRRQANFEKLQFLMNETNTNLYKNFGLSKLSQTNNQTTFQIKQFIPNVQAVHLTGDFNDWDPTKHCLEKLPNEHWIWELTFTISSDKMVSNKSKLKLAILSKNNQMVYRICPWAKYVTAPEKSASETSTVYNWSYLDEHENQCQYTFQNPHVWPKNKNLKIYEAHIGISTEKEQISTYNDFTEKCLPRIKNLGYNTIQLMAIMEHAYYGSFGYQVTNFFAASSRFGPPSDLKKLIDTAHGMGISVLLDLVISHASRNVEDGLNNLNGLEKTDPVYFHKPPKGDHTQWGSKCFDYSNYDTIKFLMSNLQFWIEEYNFDGFRFDGVTSMLYTDHASSRGFTGNLSEYFGLHVDEESIAFIQLANHFLHEKYPNIVTIAEEVSGMPGTCKPAKYGGLGFDYRLAMAVPDFLIKLLKEESDENWDLEKLMFLLNNRRHDEKHISYCESHDQALVGDKSLAFWLMDKEMYTNMSVMTEETSIISRGIALHKMLRLLVQSFAGDAYLNFMGNEFGHPEWLDFPRAGNNESYKYARRQYNLVDDDLLRYKFLNNFDRAMNLAENSGKWLNGTSPDVYGEASKNYNFVSKKCNNDKVIIFEKNDCIFCFNFNTAKSFENFQIGVGRPGKYEILLSSDEVEFGGYGNVTKNGEVQYFSKTGDFDGRPNSMKVYMPCRTAVVYRLME